MLEEAVPSFAEISRKGGLRSDVITLVPEEGGGLLSFSTLLTFFARAILGGRLEWGEVLAENGPSIPGSSFLQALSRLESLPGILGAFLPSIKPLCWGAAPIFLQGGRNSLLNFARGSRPDGKCRRAHSVRRKWGFQNRNPASSKAPFVCGSTLPCLAWLPLHLVNRPVSPLDTPCFRKSVGSSCSDVPTTSLCASFGTAEEQKTCSLTSVQWHVVDIPGA